MNKSIGLALSGGGIRAAVFHIGVLRFFAEYKQLENIKHISTVSGGTLLVGLIFHLSGNRWPTSYHFINNILPKLKKILTQKSLMSAMVHQLLLPTNWRYLISRANILAKAIESCWNVRGTLQDLSLNPIWTINGTTAENGRRFRFKQSTCGDYELGYASASNFKLAEAMAVSAAFPALIGPLAIKAEEFKWFKRDHWGDTIDTAKEINLPYKKLHIYDGGLYDNLGLEPLFDVGLQKLKEDAPEFLIVSDAGAPLKRASIPYYRRFYHITNILSEQSRAVRVRAVSNYLKQNQNAGIYLQIGSNPQEKLIKYNYYLKNKKEHVLESDQWLLPDEIETAKTFSTTLAQISTKNFSIIEQHGHETAKYNSLLFTNLFQ